MQKRDDEVKKKFRQLFEVRGGGRVGGGRQHDGTTGGWTPRPVQSEHAILAVVVAPSILLVTAVRVPEGRASLANFVGFRPGDVPGPVGNSLVYATSAASERSSGRRWPGSSADSVPGKGRPDAHHHRLRHPVLPGATAYVRSWRVRTQFQRALPGRHRAEGRSSTSSPCRSDYRPASAPFSGLHPDERRADLRQPTWRKRRGSRARAASP
jgi:hypothetical protein